MASLPEIKGPTCEDLLEPDRWALVAGIRLDGPDPQPDLAAAFDAIGGSGVDQWSRAAAASAKEGSPYTTAGFVLIVAAYTFNPAPDSAIPSFALRQLGITLLTAAFTSAAVRLLFSGPLETVQRELDRWIQGDLTRRVEALGRHMESRLGALSTQVSKESRQLYDSSSSSGVILFRSVRVGRLDWPASATR